MLQSATKTWKWWLSSKISVVTLEWSFQVFQTHIEHRNHFKIMKLKTIKNVMYTMRRRIWVGLILSLFAEGHQLGGWVEVVGIYLLFAFHSHCLPTMETWQRFITRGFAPWTSCQTQDCSHFLLIITSRLQFLYIMAMTSIPQLGGESEAIISVPTPFLKRDRITPISNVGGVKTVSGSFQHWKRFNCLETMWPIVSYHNLSLKFKIILVFETRSSENNLW